MMNHFHSSHCCFTKGETFSFGHTLKINCAQTTVTRKAKWTRRKSIDYLCCCCLGYWPIQNVTIIVHQIKWWTDEIEGEINILEWDEKYTPIPTINENFFIPSTIINSHSLAFLNIFRIERTKIEGIFRFSETEKQKRLEIIAIDDTVHSVDVFRFPKNFSSFYFFVSHFSSLP